MARAYIVLRRNDLDDNFLQTLDLVPNESLRNFPYDPAGQTHYVSFYLIDGVNLPVATTAGAYDVDSYGLSTYLKANVEDQAAGAALTDVQAVGAAADIEDDASLGNPLTAAVINGHIQAQGGVNIGTTLTAGNSTGSVEEVLRVLAGERYKAPEAAVVGTVAFVPGTGFFVTTPNVEGPGSVRNQYGAVRGRNPFTGGPVVPLTPAVQTGTEDVNFNGIRPIFDTGDLHRSAAEGALAEMKAATFAFVNSEFTYGAGGTALALDGTTNIPAGGAASAVVVYAADGTVI
jgi:hypothetical protein